MSINRIVLVGRLTADPELRYTPTGTAVCQFTLAVDRQRTNQNGEREADFINIVVWQKLGELCAQYLRKGRLAAVDGRLQSRSYENKEGQKVRVWEVVAENVRFLERAEQNGGGNGAGGQQGGNYGGQGGNGGYGGGVQPGGGAGGQSGGGYGGHSGGGNPGGGYGGGQRGNDPFSDDGKPIDISDDDLPF